MHPYSYKDSGIEWLGDIPKHWKVDRFKDVIKLRDEKVKVRSEEKNYLELEDLEQGTGRVLNYRDTVDVASAIMKFKRGDVLFGKLRPYLAKYHLAEIDGYCTGEILAMEPFRIHSSYLKFFIGGPSFIEECTVFSYGAKMPRVNWPTQIGTFQIPLPPLPEQEAIAAYLEKACARIDRVIAIKEEQLRKIEAFRDAKTFEIITGKKKKEPKKQTGKDAISSIPDSWKLVRLKSVTSKVNSGVTPKGGSDSYLDEGVPLIRSQNVRDDELNLSDVAYIADEVHHKMKNSHVLSGDVLLNITGASLGRCFYVLDLGPANVNQHVCIIRPSSLILTEFLYFVLRSEVGRAQIFSAFTGSGREGLGFEAIKRFILPSPGKDEQSTICLKLRDLYDKAKAQSDNVRLQIATLTSYRKSLIHECVTGKKQVAEIVKENEAHING